MTFNYFDTDKSGSISKDEYFKVYFYMSKALTGLNYRVFNTKNNIKKHTK